MKDSGDMKEALPIVGPNKGADFFLSKFWTQILDDPGCRNIVSWDTTGHYLIIYDTEKLMDEIKARSVCKQKDYDSFARQLRIYRWGRVRADERGMTHWPDTAKVWKHPRLNRDSTIDDVSTITRNAPPKLSRLGVPASDPAAHTPVASGSARRKATDGIEILPAPPPSILPAPSIPVRQSPMAAYAPNQIRTPSQYRPSVPHPDDVEENIDSQLIELGLYGLQPQLTESQARLRKKRKRQRLELGIEDGSGPQSGSDESDEGDAGAKLDLMMSKLANANKAVSATGKAHRGILILPTVPRIPLHYMGIARPDHYLRFEGLPWLVEEPLQPPTRPAMSASSTSFNDRNENVPVPQHGFN